MFDIFSLMQKLDKKQSKALLSQTFFFWFAAFLFIVGCSVALFTFMGNNAGTSASVFSEETLPATNPGNPRGQ